MNRYKVKPKTKINLKNWDPRDTSAFAGSKEDAQGKFAALTQELSDLQELLYAGHKHKVLAVFQGMDTSGKDGTIKSVFREVSPQGVDIADFKIPTQEELDHDYLWRIHKNVPGKGGIVLFNRSHYEDVLTVRVHKLVPRDVWRKRFAQINDFERMLAEEGTTIVKFYLNISKDEQKRRLQERLDNPRKRWKFNAGDLKERVLWNAYIKAYEDVLTRTSTDDAPWYVIPSDKNWYRNLAVAAILVDTLKNFKLKYPKPAAGLDKVRIK